MKNTKAAMDKNVENAELKAVIEQMGKENIELQLKNEKYKERMDSLEREISELKTASNDLQVLQDMESENRHLKDTIEFMKEDEAKIFNDLRETNENLRLQIENNLECYECHEKIKEKSCM